MNGERLCAAVQILGEVAQSLAELPEEHGKASDAWLTLVDAALYLSEIRHHLELGMDAYDAIVASVRGEMLISVKHVAPMVLTTRHELSVPDLPAET